MRRGVGLRRAFSRRRRPAQRLLAALLAILGATVVATVSGSAPRDAAAAEPLRVCATVPDLGSLVREIGGDRVSVTVFVKPAEDPHFAEAKPSFVKALNGADLLVENGLDLEIGWAPTLVESARNPRILAGAPGFLDASQAIAPLDVPTAAVDRSMGDVHPRGNPHYLLDPLNGLRVARLIATKLGELDPAGAPLFEQRYASFEQDLYRRMVGDALARKYGGDVAKLALLFRAGTLAPYLESQGEGAHLGGWLGALAPHRGAKAVQDHRLWTYFADRFGLVLAGALEPKPGIPPTTRHLEEIVYLMRTEGVRIVLASSYYDPRYAEFVAEKTGARVLRMASQVGAAPGTESYLDMIGYDVQQVASALAGGG